MDVSNVVRVLLEKATNCAQYAEGGDRRAEGLRSELDDVLSVAASNRRMAEEFRTAAEFLQPGSVAQWDAEVAEARRQHGEATAMGTTAVAGALMN